MNYEERQMKLRDDEKAMLDGKEGRTVQKAMEMLVRYGEALGAETFVDTNNVCGYMIADAASMKQYGSFDGLFSQFSLDSDETVPFTKVKVPSCQLETSLEPEYYDLIGRTKEDADLYNKNIEYLSKMGIQVMCTCTPYLVGNIPIKGEHCAWMESSAVAFINSVLGARTNCEGRESAISAMLTGKIPYWGYHVPENRLGTHLVNVEIEIDDIMDWGLLGYYVGEIVQDKVPVISIKNPKAARDKLKHLSAAAASGGGIELFHIPGLTAEAPTLEAAFGGKKPEETLSYGKKERQSAYDMLNSIGTNRDVDFVMLGCPHYSMEQIWHLCKLVEGKHIKAGTDFWVFTPKPIRDLAERNGFKKILEDAGIVLMRDSCPALGRFKPKNAKVMATDSAKQGHYLPNFTGIEAWYGSVEDCVQASLTGKWEGALK
jgi:predicted aconitase